MRISQSLHCVHDRAPVLQIAIAWPCRSGGLMRSSTACDKGINAAPATEIRKTPLMPKAPAS
jgi:hypothetical protein